MLQQYLAHRGQAHRRKERALRQLKLLCMFLHCLVLHSPMTHALCSSFLRKHVGHIGTQTPVPLSTRRCCLPLFRSNQFLGSAGCSSLLTVAKSWLASRVAPDRSRHSTSNGVFFGGSPVIFTPLTAAPVCVPCHLFILLLLAVFAASTSRHCIYQERKAPARLPQWQSNSCIVSCWFWPLSQSAQRWPRSDSRIEAWWIPRSRPRRLFPFICLPFTLPLPEVTLGRSCRSAAL